MTTPPLSSLKGNKCTQAYVSKHFPEFADHLISSFPEDLSWGERMWWYFHDLHSRPLCPVCGNPVSFINFSKGYHTYCSATCSNSSKERVAKQRSTCLERYGADSIFKVDAFKGRIRQTNIDRYGAGNPMQSSQILSKAQETYIKRNGALGLASDKVRTKYEKAMKETWGASHPMAVDEIKDLVREKSRQTNLSKHNSAVPGLRARYNASEESHPDLLEHTQDGLWKMACPHPKCSQCREKFYITPGNIYCNRKRNGCETCTRLRPPKASMASGTTLELRMRGLLDSYNIPYICNDKEVLGGKELDIYIPSRKIAIECNGVYWHSDRLKKPGYHMNKFNACRERDIQLLSLWEDWIINKWDIVESMLLSKLGIYERKIGARECEIREVPHKEANNFLGINHIQGKGNCKVALGLYYKGELVSLMTFGRPRLGQGRRDDPSHELTRFCSHRGWHVAGAASRLLNKYIAIYRPPVIKSFSSNDISDGGLYKVLGFRESGQNLSYWYVDPETLKRYHRFAFSKQSIKAKGLAPEGDNWTEHQVTDSLGLLRIWDSGQTKWVLEVV